MCQDSCQDVPHFRLEMWQSLFNLFLRLWLQCAQNVLAPSSYFLVNVVCFHHFKAKCFLDLLGSSKSNWRSKLIWIHLLPTQRSVKWLAGSILQFSPRSWPPWLFGANPGQEGLLDLDPEMLAEEQRRLQEQIRKLEEATAWDDL